MTTTSPPVSPPIVVAVGADGSAAAVEYAAAEAVRRQRGLHLVHAVAAPSDAQAVTAPEPVDVLDQAVRLARATVAGLVAITSHLAQAPTVSGVVAAAADAPVLVVGRRPESQWVHPYVASVTGGVAAHALVPVLSVPDDWSVPSTAPHVVVGVDDPTLSEHVLSEGFAAALGHGARLTLLCAWWRPGGAGSRPLTQVDDPDRSARMQAGLHEATAALREAFPDVEVDIEVRNTRPSDALIEASRSATLVVVGRHDPVLPAGSHLGPVARAVLREAMSPVLLSTPRHTHGHPGPTRLQEQLA